jgi:hypothetical protein
LLFRRDYMVVTAVERPVRRTVSAVISRTVLDENPGTEEIVIGHRRPDPSNPEEDLDITVRAPRRDEVYALVRLNPDRSTSRRSETRTVPEQFPFP